MEIIKQGLAFTKAECIALAEFAGSSDVREELRLVRFTSTGRLLRANVTDGARAIEVTWPIAEDQRLPILEVGVDASFFEKGAKLVTSAEAQRVAVDLEQLLRSVGGKEPAKLQIVDTENTRDGIATVIGNWSERDAVISQLSIDFSGVRRLLVPPSASASVARDVCVQPKYVMALGKVAAASRSTSCRMHMPEGMGPVLVVFREAGSGAEWTVLVCQFNDGAEAIPEDRAEEAVCLGGLQETLGGVRDPVDDTEALRMREGEVIDPVMAQVVELPPRGARRQRQQKPPKGSRKATQPTT